MTSKTIQAADLGFFSTLISTGNLGATARELGLTTAAVSKRLSQMESRLGLTLVHRTTRRMSLTAEGELYLEHTKKILQHIEHMEHSLWGQSETPQGLLRVNATLGFGRGHVGGLISQFMKQHSGLEVRLQLSVNPPPLSDDAFDVCIRFGEPPDSRVIAKRLASNRRLLVAAPSYLKRHGTPEKPTDLYKHNCIGIRQGEEAYGVWRLTNPKMPNAKAEVIKTRGALSTNDGEIAVNWALDGHGILMRAEWDIQRYLQSGRLVQVLGDWQTPPADIYAVYPERHQTTARVKVFVDWMAEHLRN